MNSLHLVIALVGIACLLYFFSMKESYVQYTGTSNDPNRKVISKDGTCGPDHGGKVCPYPQCCNANGKCGGKRGTVDASYCTSYDLSDGVILVAGGDWTNMVYDSVGNVNWQWAPYDGKTKVAYNEYDVQITDTDRCGRNNEKACPGSQCCSESNYCGGNINSGQPDGYCTKRMSWRNPQTKTNQDIYRGYQGDQYDGDDKIWSY